MQAKSIFLFLNLIKHIFEFFACEYERYYIGTGMWYLINTSIYYLLFSLQKHHTTTHIYPKTIHTPRRNSVCKRISNSYYYLLFLSKKSPNSPNTPKHHHKYIQKDHAHTSQKQQCEAHKAAFWKSSEAWHRLQCAGCDRARGGSWRHIGGLTHDEVCMSSCAQAVYSSKTPAYAYWRTLVQYEWETVLFQDNTIEKPVLGMRDSTFSDLRVGCLSTHSRTPSCAYRQTRAYTPWRACTSLKQSLGVSRWLK